MSLAQRRKRVDPAETLMTIEARPADDRSMPLSATLAWLVDAAAATPTPELFLATLGQRLIEDGAPLAGGALTLASPHPLIARRTWLWRADSNEVVEALGIRGRSAFRDWERMVRPATAGAGLQGSRAAPCMKTLLGLPRTARGSDGSDRARSPPTRPTVCVRPRASRRRRSPR